MKKKVTRKISVKNSKPNYKLYLGILSILVLTVFVVALRVLNINPFDNKGAYAFVPSGYIYVSSTGLDTNNGLTENTPVKTIQKAVTLAKPGNEVRIAPGTYRENVVISKKIGTQTAPIVFVGTGSDPASYPVIDGGDPSFVSKSEKPAFKITDSSWISFERLKVVNATYTSFDIINSKYIVVRRNIVDFNKHGVKLSNKSNHILLEYNEMYQRLPSGYSWSTLKNSKYEGGAFVSFGGAGMNVIRYNNIHDTFNGIYMSKGSRTGNYYDSNVWVYRNRFENVIDDPFEPETYAFNNHFFHNTLINTHRMASFTPNYANMLGPVYVYGNYQMITTDPTKESVTLGRANSALKVELSKKFYINKAYFFNNTADIQAEGVNTYGYENLTLINNLVSMNNVFKTQNRLYAETKNTVKGSTLTSNMSSNILGYNEVGSFATIDPLLSDKSQEDGRLTLDSPARGKAKEVAISLGFSSPVVVSALSDLGAYVYGENDFRSFPNPVYVAPPGGELAGSPANVDWIPDYIGGVNPLYSPIWKE